MLNPTGYLPGHKPAPTTIINLTQQTQHTQRSPLPQPQHSPELPESQYHESAVHFSAYSSTLEQCFRSRQSFVDLTGPMMP